MGDVPEDGALEVMQANCDTSTGYTLLEPSSISRLCADPKCHGLAVLILNCVASEANARKLAGDGVFKVILANYHGEYPAIGLRGQPSDMSYDAACAATDSLALELVSGQAVEKLMGNAISSRLDWRKVAFEVLKK